MDGFTIVVWAGCVLGTKAALVAIGMAQMAKVTHVVNLAVGEFFVIGGFLAATCTAAGLPPALAALLAAAVGAVVCMLQERFVLRRQRHASPSVLLLGTVAVAVLLEGVQLLVWGPNGRLGEPVVAGASLLAGAVPVEHQGLLLVVVALALAIAASAAFERSAMGRAMAAVAEDPDAARITGVDVFRLRTIGAAATGGMVALGGALAAAMFPVTFTQGLPLSLAGFVAMAAGRMTVLGSLAGGLGLGVLGSLLSRYASSLYEETLVFLLLAAVVLLTPALGGQTREEAL